ncbi:keratinocyte-associated protein 2-like [Ruditapes philippinarum]|uniref:keratinocyte-associated protein 2-like n=1 Tax=Ruditapes philippinarum TaxID=129788 RepID=UPI00295C0C04|nr:keratinocyte-associated protein 2-like [Ruditapes philippinarum]
MAVSTGASLMLSTTLMVLCFAGMQMFRQQLGGAEYMTIVGGFIGSIVFILVLTAVNNFESLMFGEGFHSKVPEVIFSLLVAMISSGLVHRVCVTTCLIFSLVALFYINKISQVKYAAAAPVQVKHTPKKKK